MWVLKKGGKRIAGPNHNEKKIKITFGNYVVIGKVYCFLQMRHFSILFIIIADDASFIITVAKQNYLQI